MQVIWEWLAQLPRRVQLIVGSMGVVVLIGLGWMLLRPEATSVATGTPPPATTNSALVTSRQTLSSGATGISKASTVSHDTRVFVDVQGAVKRPGLYQFSQGMRVADALKTAGGLVARADRKRINLATRLVDQQQLYIPLKGEKTPATNASPTDGGAATGTSAGAASSSTPVVNLNTATVADLQQLTGVGAKKAQKIVDYRNEHGDFKSVSDL